MRDRNQEAAEACAALRERTSGVVEPRGLAHSVAKVLGGRTTKRVIASPAIRLTGNELECGRSSMANLFPKSIFAALLIQQLRRKFVLGPPETISS